MADSATSAPCYELVAAHDLPTIDVRHTLLSVLLRPTAAKSVRNWMSNVEKAITFLYGSAFPIGASALVISPAIARPLAVLKISLQIPVLLSGSTDLQVDILRCLATTYEFWFFTLLNAVTSIIFMLHLGDARMTMIPAYWYGIQMNVWSDAKIEARQLAVGSVLAALYHVFLLVIFGLNLVPEPHPFVLLQLGGHALMSHEFLINAFATMLILMMRTAFRKRSLGKKDKDDPNVVGFVGYRCRLLMRPPPVHPPGPSTSQTTRPAEAVATRQKMRLVTQAPIQDKRAVFVPRLLDWTPTRWQRLSLHSVGVLAFVGTAFTNVYIFGGYESKHPSVDKVLLPISIASLVSTLAYCGLLFGLYHRHLLARIFASFDVLFVMLQVSCAQIALCSLLDWSWRGLPVLTAWIWRLLVTTQDSLTLETRRTLYLRRRLTTLIVLLDIWVQALVTVMLLDGGVEVLRDHVLLRVSLWSDKVYEFRAATFYLGRAFTTMLWSLRLLWRVASSEDDVLIKITGGVEFDGNPHAARRQRNQRFSLRFLHQARVEPTS